MNSRKLLPALSELPSSARKYKNARESIEHLIATEPALSASEFAVAVSIGTWGIWDRINVSDQLHESYAAQYPNLAAEHSLHDHWEAVQDRGPESMVGFVSGLKGKLAEIRAAEILENEEYTDVNIAANPAQESWDISAINPDGEQVLFQVKTGTADYGRSISEEIVETEGIDFLLGSEIYSEVAPASANQVAELMDIGPDYELVNDVVDGLETLSENEGIDILDMGDILPVAAGLIIGIRLIHGALKAEREFKEVDRTAKNKIQIVQALTLMARFGVTYVVSTIGGTAGAAVGSMVPVPIVGNLVGGIVGAASASLTVGRYLNKRLQPHMLNLGLNITGLTDDDLFYVKNKKRIMRLGESYLQTADGLDAATL